MRKLIQWFLSVVILASAVIIIVKKPLPFLFYHNLPNVELFGRSLYVIILASLMCLYRLVLGPSGADRIAAVNILGIVIVGLCALLTIPTGRFWYLDIGIAWAVQNFISMLAFSKYLEGKNLDE